MLHYHAFIIFQKVLRIWDFERYFVARKVFGKAFQILLLFSFGRVYLCQASWASSISYTCIGKIAQGISTV